MKKLLGLTALICLPLCGCPPVVVETNAPPPPPAAVEVDAGGPEYYFVGGVYYDWDPGYNRWVVYHGVPDRRFVVHRMDRLPGRPLRREVRRDDRMQHRDVRREDDHDEHR